MSFVWASSSSFSQAAPIDVGVDLSGQVMRLEIPPGKTGAALFFFSLKCPCAKNSLGEVQAHEQKLHELGYVTYYINTDRVTEPVTRIKLFKLFRVPDPVFDDREWKLVQKYAITSSSQMVILDSKKEILYQGAFQSDDVSYLDWLMEDLSASRKPRVQIGAGIGCALEDPNAENPFAPK